MVSLLIAHNFELMIIDLCKNFIKQWLPTFSFLIASMMVYYMWYKYKIIY
jgi:hypothetical protein